MTKAKHSKAMVQRTKAAIRNMTRVLPRVGACLFLLDTSTPAVYRKASLRVRSLPPPREGDPLSHAWFGAARGGACAASGGCRPAFTAGIPARTTPRRRPAFFRTPGTEPAAGGRRGRGGRGGQPHRGSRP